MRWKVCNEPRCPKLTTTTKCDTHTPQAPRRRRDPAYNTAGHRAFRLAVLHRDPICVLCHIAVATDADHYPKDRQQLVIEGHNPNDPEQGRGLCKSCHSTETALHQPGGWNRT